MHRKGQTHTSIISDICGDPATKLQKCFRAQSVWCSYGSFPGCLQLNSCELANIRCHAALSDMKHMSTEVERKAQHRPTLTQSRYTIKGKRAAEASLALLVSLSGPANNEPLVSLISQKPYQPSNKVSKKRAAFHFRVHLVPKICKVLNQEVALSQLHTEPFIPILGENSCKEISHQLN